MLERIKSLTLLLLVAMSFYLTYNLWWEKPSFDPLTPTAYETPKMIGSQRSWQDLLKAQELIFHYEGNRHTRATIDMSIYQIVWDSIQRWQFSNLQEITINLEQGREILEERNGLEFTFVDNIPVPYFAEVIQLPVDLMNHLDTFNRIWIYKQENTSDYNALFISDTDRKVIKTTLLDMGVNNSFTVRNLILLGAQLNSVQPIQYVNDPDATIGVNIDFFDILYVPVGRTYMNQWTYAVNPIELEDITNALFVDITAMKEIPERGDSRIFTDGTKSLQYKENSNELRFYLPAYEHGLNESRSDEIYQAVDFMNQHHGWTGTYQVDTWVNDLGEHSITFREHISGFPIYSEESPLGTITLSLQNNQVNEYARTLLRLESFTRAYQLQIKSGKDLLDELREMKVYVYSIKHIQLSYKATYDRENQQAELIPQYIIHFKSNRDPLMIDARVQSMGE